MAQSLAIRVPYVDTGFMRAVLVATASDARLGKADLARHLEPPLPDKLLRKTRFLAPAQEGCSGAARDATLERALRGWARIVLRARLETTGVGVMRAAAREAAVRSSEYRAGLPPLRRFMHKLQAAAARTAYLSTNAGLRIAALILWPRARPTGAEQVCVFRIGNIGDVVCALPAIAQVRRAYPRARLTLLTSPGRRGMPGAAEVLEGSDLVDELWVYHAEDIDTLARQSALLRDVRARRFSVWIVLPNELATVTRQIRDMSFAWMAGVGWARGWRIDTLNWAAQAQSEYLHFSNEVERMLEVVRRCGIEALEAEFPIASPAGAKARIDALLLERGLSGHRLVAIAPGAKRSTNLWPPERFAEVGRELSSQGYAVLLVGGRSEAAVCASLVQAIGPGAHSFAGELSVVESCELLRGCRLAVCLDSGVQHLASAVGTPCVSLFSFWQMRGKWHPWGTQNVVLQKWVPCHTCLLEQCPNDNRCMKAIGVEEVVRHARDLLAVSPLQIRPVAN